MSHVGPAWARDDVDEPRGRHAPGTADTTGRVHPSPRTRRVRQRRPRGGGRQAAGGLGWAFRAGWRVTAHGCEISFGGDEHVLKPILLMAARLCEKTPNHVRCTLSVGESHGA